MQNTQDIVKKYFGVLIFINWDQSLMKTLESSDVIPNIKGGWLKLRSASCVLCDHVTPIKLNGKF